MLMMSVNANYALFQRSSQHCQHDSSVAKMRQRQVLPNLHTVQLMFPCSFPFTCVNV